jgi:DNA-binding IclR family transcriptional regulator
VRALTAWSFLTNHALVLACIGQQPESTGLQIAQRVGITERATRRIVDDLQAAGYVEREKVGRRNRYRVDLHRTVARFGERELTVRQFLELDEDRADWEEADHGPTTLQSQRT